MSWEDRWHTPATRQQGYVERRHAPQVTHCMITHTLHWSTKIIICQWTQALISSQSNDLIKITGFTIYWMTQEHLQQVKISHSRQKTNVYFLQLQKMLQNTHSSKHVSELAHKGVCILQVKVRPGSGH